MKRTPTKAHPRYFKAKMFHVKQKQHKTISICFTWNKTQAFPRGKNMVQ